MKAIEFEAIAKDGMIKVPKEYLNTVTDKLRVIILMQESKEATGKEIKKRELKALKIKTKDFKFNLTEANEK